MELPNELRVGLERELRGVNPTALARDAANLSARYRGPDESRPIRRGTDAMAYAATRMPATFAATAAAMAAMRAARPDFAPRTLLDVGAGTGAALWAAAETWPTLEAATLVEGDLKMLELGLRLAAGGRGTVAAARWAAADLAGPWDAPPHDLVTAAYVLGELPEDARAQLVDRLWERTEGELLLIEPGTPRGWTAIRAAREQLRAAGAYILAPCPHAGPCPMPDDDWCHFSRRLARSRIHRAAKGADLGFEDEKYSYIAAARESGHLAGARLLRHPLVRPGRIELALCARDGLQRATVTKAQREAWRLARDLTWGDALPPGALGKPS